MIHKNMQSGVESVPRQAQQIIISSDSLDTLWQQIDYLDPVTSLVVFDIDLTLIRPLSLFFANFWENCKQMLMALDRLDKSKAKDKFDFFLSKIMVQDYYVLVEEKILTMIKKLQEKNIKTIALTALPAGVYGCIENTEQWRLAQLAQLGISFKQAFAHLQQQLVLSCQNCYPIDLTSSIVHSPVVYQEGIIFSGDYSKGDALEEFLTTINWVPQKIIFADDSDLFVDNVAAMCQRRNIEFFGIHYHGAKKSYPPVDDKLVQFQLQYLAEHEEWLDDNKARTYMLRQVTTTEKQM